MSRRRKTSRGNPRNGRMELSPAEVASLERLFEGLAVWWGQFEWAQLCGCADCRQFGALSKPEFERMARGERPRPAPRVRLRCEVTGELLLSGSGPGA